MVTSKKMLRVVSILLCLVLGMAGLCSGLCLVERPAHSCCHEKNHCGHAGKTMTAHEAVATARTIPVILTQPVLLTAHQFADFRYDLGTPLTNFSPPLQTAVLRI